MRAGYVQFSPICGCISKNTRSYISCNATQLHLFLRLTHTQTQAFGYKFVVSKLRYFFSDLIKLHGSVYTTLSTSWVLFLVTSKLILNVQNCWSAWVKFVLIHLHWNQTWALFWLTLWPLSSDTLISFPVESKASATCNGVRKLSSCVEYQPS